MLCNIDSLDYFDQLSHSINIFINVLKYSDNLEVIVDALHSLKQLSEKDAKQTFNMINKENGIAPIIFYITHNMIACSL